MTTFKDLKPEGHEEFWELHQESITSTLNQMNSEVFDDKWRLVSPCTSSVIVAYGDPRISKHGSVCLKAEHSFYIAVCVENDAKSLRIYTRLGPNKFGLRRQFNPDDFAGFCRTFVIALFNFGQYT